MWNFVRDGCGDAKALFSLALCEAPSRWPVIDAWCLPRRMGTKVASHNYRQAPKTRFSIILKVPHVELLIFPKGRRHLRRERAEKFQESGRCRGRPENIIKHLPNVPHVEPMTD